MTINNSFVRYFEIQLAIKTMIKVFVQTIKLLLECDPTIICHHPYFLRIFKIWNMLHHESVGRVQSKECYLMFTYTFLASFCCFFIISFFFMFFYHFHFFFDEVSNFCNIIIHNQKPKLVIIGVSGTACLLRQMQSRESKEREYISSLVLSLGKSGDGLDKCVFFTSIFIQGYTKPVKTLYT